MDTGNGLGTGTIQVGTAQTGDSSAGLLQNSSSEAIGLVNSIEFLADATFSVGQGMQFNAPDQPGSPPPVEVAASCTLTVTGQNSSEGPPILEFADDLISDTDSDSNPFALDVQAISPAEVDLGGAIAGTVNAGGTTDLLLTGNLVASASITADNQSTVELGFAAQQIPVTGSGTLTVFNGATIKALTANPNFSGTVVLSGGTVQVGVSDGLGTATIQTNAATGNALSSADDDVLQLANALKLTGNLTLDIGAGISFSNFVAAANTGVEVAQNCTLTVTGGKGQDPTLSFAGNWTSDQSGVQLATLTIAADEGISTSLVGDVAAELTLAGSTALVVDGNLDNNVISVGGSSGPVLVLGNAATGVPVTGTGVKILVDTGGILKAALANPNLSGQIILNGGVLSVTANNGTGSATIEQLGPTASTISGDPIINSAVDVQSGTLDVQGQFTFTQGVTVPAGANLDVQNAGTLVALQGSLSVGGAIGVAPNSTLVVASSNNPFSGTVTQAGGTVTLLGTDSLGTGKLVGPVTVPPVIVTSVEWSSILVKTGKGKHAKTKSEPALRVTYSAPVSGAAGLGAYELSSVTTKKVKKKSVTSLKPVRLSSVVAASSPSATSVELVPAGRFKIGPKYELEIIGADLSDSLGRALDGNDDGEPGGNFVATFGRSGETFALPSAQLSSAPPIPRSRRRGTRDHAPPPLGRARNAKWRFGMSPAIVSRDAWCAPAAETHCTIAGPGVVLGSDLVSSLFAVGSTT